MSVYEQEQNRMENPAKGGGGSGGGDFSWLSTDKPASKGQKSYRNMRIVQRLALDAEGKPDPSRPLPEFWKRVSVHRATVDGKFSMLVCPEDRDVPGWRDRATCPLCLLQKELWATRRADFDEVAKSFGARWRVYCNVIDLDDIAGHWHEDGAGGWTVHPKVYGYSKRLHNAMMSICVHNGPIEDFATGRPLVLECERTGPKKENVQYAITHKDREAIPTELMPIVWGAYDLEGLGKPAAMETLQKAAQALDPRAATGGAARYAAPAAPPAHAAPAGHAPPPAAPAGPPTAAPPAHAPPPHVAAPAHAGPPGTPQAASSYQPQGQYQVGAPPAAPAAAPPAAAPPPPAPPAAAAPPAPPAPPAAPVAALVIYHYSGPTGQQEGLTAAAVAQIVAADPHGQHSVWNASMAGWGPASGQPDIVAQVQQAPAPASPAVGGPPAAGGPPGPPGGPPGGNAF